MQDRALPNYPFQNRPRQLYAIEDHRRDPWRRAADVVARQADGGDDRGADGQRGGEPVLNPPLFFERVGPLHFAHASQYRRIEDEDEEVNE